MLESTNQEISNLLVFSKHKIDESSKYGSKLYSTLSVFEIISPPVQTFQLKKLSEEKQNLIYEAVLLIYPKMDNAPEITKLRFVADPNLSRAVEYVQYIDNDILINDISLAMNLLERKPPKFWVDYKSINSSLYENDFRAEFFRMLGMKYKVGTEEESKIGRTDLTIVSSSINRKIFEFKVWGRNDYLSTTKQLLRYLTETDDVGFIIMANNRKTENISDEEYNSVIENSELVENSKKNKITFHGIKYYQADYNFNGNIKKIFHFILNLK